MERDIQVHRDRLPRLGRNLYGDPIWRCVDSLHNVESIRCFRNRQWCDREWLNPALVKPKSHLRQMASLTCYVGFNRASVKNPTVLARNPVCTSLHWFFISTQDSQLRMSRRLALFNTPLLLFLLFVDVISWFNDQKGLNDFASALAEILANIFAETGREDDIVAVFEDEFV